MTELRVTEKFVKSLAFNATSGKKLASLVTEEVLRIRILNECTN